MSDVTRDVPSPQPAEGRAAAVPAAGEQPSRGEGEVARRYQAVIEMAPDATVVADHQGHIRLVNRQAEVLFGYAREDLLGQSVERLMPERFYAAHRARRAAYVAAPSARLLGASLQLFGRRQDGREFPVEVSLGPLDDEGETLIIASIRNISERLRAEAAQQELARLHALTDPALARLNLDDLLSVLLDRVQHVMEVDNAAVLLLDAAGNELWVWAVSGPLAEVTMGIHVPVGQGYAGRIAATREPLILSDPASFPAANPLWRERVQAAVGVPLLLEERLLGVLLVASTGPRAFTDQEVRLLQRVAERLALAIERSQVHAAEQHAQREAEAAQARLRRVIEAGIIGIAVGKGETYRDANDEFLRMVGYTREDLLAGRVAVERRTPQDDAEYGDADARARQELLTSGVCTPYERDFLRPDGTRLPVLVGAAVLNREPFEWVGFAVDISERKRIEREREVARTNELALREANRYLNEVFRTAAHDLRSPVAAALGFAEIAQLRFAAVAAKLQARGGKQAEQATRALETVLETRRSLDRLARLSAELFDTAQLRSGSFALHLAPLDLAALVREQVAAQRAAMPSRHIVLDLPDGAQPVWVQGDVIRLEQVLANYLSNALKYSAEDQPVTVRLDVAEQVAVVSVRDQGPGLPWEEQSRVWEMFYRAPGVAVQSSAEGSLGLGLHIAKRLMGLHPGGQVGVESVVGEGSTFWFTLPLGTDAAEAAKAAPAPSTSPEA